MSSMGLLAELDDLGRVYLTVPSWLLEDVEAWLLALALICVPFSPEGLRLTVCAELWFMSHLTDC